ncbi:MAG: hypothetical protein M5U28_31020 [Sandaracinaceae bacterium]|nr:hypothetical protein [Sandaracinaceae bacterium]
MALEVDGGVHRLRGDRDVGAMVYGLGKDTSYATPPAWTSSAS